MYHVEMLYRGNTIYKDGKVYLRKVPNKSIIDIMLEIDANEFTFGYKNNCGGADFQRNYRRMINWMHKNEYFFIECKKTDYWTSSFNNIEYPGTYTWKAVKSNERDKEYLQKKQKYMLNTCN